MRFMIYCLLALILFMSGCIQRTPLSINTSEQFAIYLNESHLKLCNSASNCTVIISDCSRAGRGCGGPCDKLVPINKKYYDELEEIRNKVCSDFWNRTNLRDYYLLYDCLYQGVWPKYCYESIDCINNSCVIVPKNESPVNASLLRAKLLEAVKKRNNSN